MAASSNHNYPTALSTFTTLSSKTNNHNVESNNTNTTLCNVNINSIPQEVVLLIVQFCDPEDILRCSMVCKDWSELCGDNRLWKTLFRAYWGKIAKMQLGEEDSEVDWKHIFKGWYMMELLHRSIFDDVSVITVSSYILAARFFTERKIIVVGAGFTGKSTLVIQFIQHFFVDDYDPTIEDSYRCVRMVDKKPIIFDILDTAGQEEYQTMFIHFNYTKAHGVVIVFSVTSRPSFEAARKYYYSILKERQRRFPCILVGTKTDMNESRVISEEEGIKLGLELRVPYLELSCKEKEKVEKAFAGLEKMIEQFEFAHKKTRGSGRSKRSKQRSPIPNSFFIYGEDDANLLEGCEPSGRLKEHAQPHGILQPRGRNNKPGKGFRRKHFTTTSETTNWNRCNIS